MAGGITSRFSTSFRAGERPLTITSASQIPDLNVWYNSSSATTYNSFKNITYNNFQSNPITDGTNVTAWNDIAGAAQAHPANVNNGAGGNSPKYKTSIQNGLSSLLFTASNLENLDINPVAWVQSLAGLTIYIAARPTSFPASTFPLFVTDTNLGIWWNNTNWSIGQSVGNVGTATLGNDTTKFHIYGIIFDGTQSGNANRLKFRYDELDVTLTYTGTIGVNTGLPSQFFVGGINRATANLGKIYMNGYIAELMLWTRVLNFNEQLAAETYLSNKWSI